MANLNRVLLMGNLTHDPEMRYAAGGGRESGPGRDSQGRDGMGREGGGGVCKLRLAVNRKWRNQSGEMQDEVLYIDVAVFGRQAENCAEYLRKGRPVFIEGRLKLNEWQDRESGQKRSKVEVVAENVQFLGSRDGGPSGGMGAADGVSQRPPRDEAQAAPRTAARSGVPGASVPGAGDPGASEINFDDIPF